MSSLNSSISSLVGKSDQAGLIVNGRLSGVMSPDPELSGQLGNILEMYYLMPLCDSDNRPLGLPVDEEGRPLFAALQVGAIMPLDGSPTRKIAMMMATGTALLPLFEDQVMFDGAGGEEHAVALAGHTAEGKTAAILLPLAETDALFSPLQLGMKRLMMNVNRYDRQSVHDAMAGLVENMVRLAKDPFAKIPLTEQQYKRLLTIGSLIAKLAELCEGDSLLAWAV